MKGQEMSTEQECRECREPAEAGGFSGSWLWNQGLNLARHARALRPFVEEDFATGQGGPRRAHLAAANRLLARLLRRVAEEDRRLRSAGARAVTGGSGDALRSFLGAKDRGQRWVQHAEKVWSFYFDLFSQRGTAVGERLQGADQIAVDCYRAVYTSLGKARSVPSPPPFSHLEGRHGPATYRRGITMRRLGRRRNPFPIIKLPYHRLVNPWTLGAVPHEVAHNLQADLGLWDEIPRQIERTLRGKGVPAGVSKIWRRWHKEVFADLLGLLLSGPAFVASLTTVVAKEPRLAFAFHPGAVHPVPYLRLYLSTELLRRLGFRRRAARFDRLWRRLYPRRLEAALPAGLRRTFGTAHRAVVDTLCFRSYEQLGGKKLVEVVSFGQREQTMVREAGRRLAQGESPGVLPERFLIGAARHALDLRLAPPTTITDNFYRALGRR